MNGLSIFDYQSARRFLLDAVELEKKTNSRFSIRKWAKEMGMQNHALLVFILQGKRTLTLRQVPQLSLGLKLSTPERVYFQALVQLENAKSPEEKELIRSWFQDYAPGKNYRVKEVDEYQAISHWIHMAILSRTFSKKGFTDINELVGKFKSRLSSIEIHSAFERLKDLGYITWSKDEKRFKATFNRVTTRDDVINRGVREYHKQVAALAIDSIESQDVHEREFQSFAINVQQNKIKTIKEMMRKFRSQIEAELRDTEDANENISENTSEDTNETEELYQMNLQFFRLTDEPCVMTRKEPVFAGASTHNTAELAAEKGSI